MNSGGSNFTNFVENQSITVYAFYFRNQVQKVVYFPDRGCVRTHPTHLVCLRHC